MAESRNAGADCDDHGGDDDNYDGVKKVSDTMGNKI